MVARPDDGAAAVASETRAIIRPMDADGLQTRDLAIYAAIVGTLSGLWNLYAGIFRDRARVVLRVADATAIVPGAPEMDRPVFWVTVSNRGRRAVQVTAVAYLDSARTGVSQLSMDIVKQMPKRLEEGESCTLVHGDQGGYTKGSLPLRRWYAIDGAGRKHPLRERYRQRLEAAVMWPLRRRAK
jgi:hypothetical protein